MDSADLMPLPKGEIQVGEPIKFPVFDSDGNLLLAAGQLVSSEKQLNDLFNKGMFCNPAWLNQFDSAEARRLMGTVKPSASIYSPVSPRAIQKVDPAESGRLMRMGAPDLDEPYSVKLIGEIGREVFLVTHPVRDGSYVFLKEGQIWEFRAFYGTSVFRFESVVQKVFLNPQPIVVMSWPLETSRETKLIRASRRATCRVGATFKIKEEPDTPFSAIVSDVSTGGAEVIVSRSLRSRIDQGSMIDLSFQLALGNHKFLIDSGATVMNVAEEDNNLILGVQFAALKPVDFGLIHGYVMDRAVSRVESGLYNDGG